MRILVVEDVPAFANAIAEGLRDQAMAVDVAYDGHEAAVKLDLNPYDVVVLDRDLPGIHGDTLCQLIAESEGATLRDATRLVVYVTDMYRFRPIVNKIQEEFWGKGPYPPRTIIEVHRLNGDDICEVEGTFYAPVKK